VAEGGEFQAQKWCGSKPPLTIPKSHAHSVSNLIEVRGHLLVVKPHPDLEEESVNEQGLVVKTSSHSINENHGGSGHGDRTISSRYHNGWFFLHAHAGLSLHLTEVYTHNLTEGCTEENLWMRCPHDSFSGCPLI
jgi:hypothetical protein